MASKNLLHLIWFSAFLLLFGLAPTNARADLVPGDPVGGTCGFPAVGFTLSLDIFENSAPQPTIIGQCVHTGTLALLENSTSSLSNPGTWSDVAVFAFDGSNYTVTLLTPSQFGSITSADLGIPESASGLTSFVAGCVSAGGAICPATTEITYNFHSPEEAPEPSSLLLLGAGLLGLAGMSWRKKLSA
jgi:hypothetical protein